MKRIWHLSDLRVRHSMLRQPKTRESEFLFSYHISFSNPVGTGMFLLLSKLRFLLGLIHLTPIIDYRLQKKIFHVVIQRKLMITIRTTDVRFHILSGQRFAAGRTDQSSFLCLEFQFFHGGIFHNVENLHRFSVFSRENINIFIHKKIPESKSNPGLRSKLI